MKRVAGWLSVGVLGLCLTTAGVRAESTATRCQILDRPDPTALDISATYVDAARFGQYGRSAFVEFNAALKLGYLWDVLGGSMDMGVNVGGRALSDSAGLQLPDQLGDAAVDVGMTWRYPDGSAFQLRAAPGVHSDMEAFDNSIVYVPVSVALIRAFDPTAAGILGVQFRPGFENRVLPMIGVAWEPTDWLRLEPQFPESRAIVYFEDGWRTHLSVAWQDPTYSLGDKGGLDREKLTLQEWRTALGMTHCGEDGMLLTAEIGWAFDRSASFEEPAPGLDQTMDIEDAAFFRVSVGFPM